MINVILSLGTNLGNREEHMDKMVVQLKKKLQPPVTISKLMETEPIGTPDRQSWYYNRIISGYYDSSVQSLLTLCQESEKDLGRKMKNTYEARTADIDILLVDNCIISEPNLTVPHQQLLNRRFCIEGIASIAPDWEHPIEKKTFREILKTMDKHVREQKINFIDI